MKKRCVRRSACKPGSVPCGCTATVISLAGRLPGRSSGLPEGRNGPDQPCPLIWPCSRWGLPSQPVTRLLVGSYIKELALPRLFTLTQVCTDLGGMLSVALSLSFDGRLCEHSQPPRTVGITHHRVLGSPDFPLPGRSSG